MTGTFGDSFTPSVLAPTRRVPSSPSEGTGPPGVPDNGTGGWVWGRCQYWVSEVELLVQVLREQ